MPIMAEIKIFDAKGKAAGTVDAPEKLAGANAPVTLVHQVAVAELAGRRQGTAKTKRRDEVQGSNVKIRRQKGTGRSRQGDKRTPHMRGGGVVHGPVPRDYGENTPRKMKQAAFRTVLNSRLQNDRIFVLDGEIAAPKTKDFIALLATMGLSDYKLLLLANAAETNIQLSARNIPKVTVQGVNQTNVTDVLRADAILFTKAAWQEMAERVEGKSKSESKEAA
jgi:large subunit ribosomal protein L4